MHPVLALIASRSATGHRRDGQRLALVIEGGGMRGAISGGMVMALESLGLGGVFDAVYGASAGALNGAWFLSGAANAGMPGWSEPELRTAAIGRRNLLRGRPFVDGRFLMDVVYEELTPLPFDRVLANDASFHPTATDARSGRSVDLGPSIHDIPSLKRALRASTALPLLSGRPVRVGEGRYFDAGIAESVPFRTAVAQAATHVLVLRSRRADEQETAEGGRSAGLVARYLNRHSPGLAEAFLARPARLRTLDAELAAQEADPGAAVAVLSLRPPPETPSIDRLELDQGRVSAGLDAGRAEVEQVLAPVLPHVPRLPQ